MTLKEHLRTLLRDSPMTTKQLSTLTGSNHSNVLHALRGMADAYIKEYQQNRGRPATVWAVVVPPPNALPPKKK